jgi:uncharacterized membrane protein
VLLIAPTTYHRLRWRERDKEQLLRTSNRLAIAGTACVAVGMTAAVYLVTDTVFNAVVSAIVTALVAVVFAWFWYGLPLWRRVEQG